MVHGSTVPNTANIAVTPEQSAQSGPSSGTGPPKSRRKRELDKLNDELSLRCQPKTENRKKLDYEVLLKTIKLIV